ncbi:MAG: DUF3108 domain-containing protein [Bacteroidetes bacterium]|nr:MAG: DUF3108 domain-containing protein [Bacteroidota bacterium]
MKKIASWALLIMLASGFVAEGNYRTIKNDTFKQGEHVEYLVHYGMLTAGTATVDVQQKKYTLNNRMCYRVDVVGKTSGFGGALVRVEDTWRTYIDTSAFVSHRFYRHLEEGEYRREEVTDFSPLQNSAVMKYEDYSLKDDANKPHNKGKKTFKTPDYVQDMISGYYYLRTIDFSKYKEGDIITISGVLEDATYTLQIRYKGKEEVKTKFGRINAHRLVPIMPANQMFSGENSVRFWVSDDKNRVPVRVEADMFIGKVVCEIRDYSNLRYKMNFR